MQSANNHFFGLTWAIIMFWIITIYTNAAVIMTMAIVVIKKFTHYISIATKTMTKFPKSFKKYNFCCFFNMIKEHNSLIFAFSFKNRSFFIILSTKFINLNCTAS